MQTISGGVCGSRDSRICVSDPVPYLVRIYTAEYHSGGKVRKMKERIAYRKKCLQERRQLRQNTVSPVTSWYLDAAWEHREDTPALREAYGTLAYYQNVGQPLWPEERFCGTLKHREAAGFAYGGGTWVDFHRVEELIRQQDMDESAAGLLRDKAQWLEENRYHTACAAIFTKEEYASIEACAASSTWFGGHMVLDYRTILAQGLGGYAKRIGEAPDTPFYRAMAIQLQALQTYIRRYAEKAKECAALAEYDRDRMQELSEILDKIVVRPPETFEEALQLIWILHITNDADSFGRFDSYLRPFYEKDIREGRLTRMQAYEDLVDIWMKIEDADAIQNMTIGGVAADGSPEYSELTLLCLEVTRAVAYKGPNLCLRIAENMPDAFWKAALECLETGIGLPALYHDEAYIDMLCRAGYELSVSRDYCLAGCSQVMLPGQCNFINDIGLYNIAKVMELTLYGGVDPLTGVQVGLKTPPLPEMQSFEELLEAFDAQNRYFIRLETQIQDKDAVYRNAHEGYNMRSLFTRGCLESGKGIFAGGANYNNTELEIIGITNAADSLYAVKKAVFETGRYTGEELLSMLKNNFDGHETDRLWLHNKIEKFGNDVAEPDELRAYIAQTTYRQFNETPAVLGGVYVPGEVIFTAHEYTGTKVGATPDGRLAGTVLADSMGACQGVDKNGPTALMRSVTRTQAARYFLTTPVLNLRFLASVWEDAQNHSVLQSLFQNYFKDGGMQLQINVCDGQILKKALEDPDEYRSLVVRVGGYSDYFVNLTPALQREIISRTEYRM